MERPGPRGGGDGSSAALDRPSRLLKPAEVTLTAGELLFTDALSLLPEAGFIGAGSSRFGEAWGATLYYKVSPVVNHCWRRTRSLTLTLFSLPFLNLIYVLLEK